MTRELVILLEDVKLDKNFEFDGDVAVESDDRKKKFTCYICMAKFSSALNMSKHKALHGDSELEDDTVDDEETWSKPKSKNVCPQNSSNKLSLKPKITSSTENITKNCDKTKCDEAVAPNEPQKITPFKCETCDVFFESSDDAKLHTVSNKCKFLCKICGRKFNTLYAFVVHVMQHRSNAAKSHNSSQMVYTCTTCKQSFDNCLLLRSHELNTHAPKSDNAPNDPQPVTNPSRDETNVTVKEEPMEPPVHDQSPITDTTATESNEICCELCYDVFETTEDLNSHMEFHKQLEDKSDAIVIEDDESEVVEVFEEKKDPHEIITTIKSTTKPPRKKVIPPSVRPTVTATTSLQTTSTHSLTDAIKDLLTPKVEKQSKTILLPPSVTLPSLIPISKLKKVEAKSKRTSQAENSNVELRRTGPLSYSLYFKEDGTISTTSTEGTSNAITNCTVSNKVPIYSTSHMNSNQMLSVASTNSTSTVANSPLKFFITNVPYVSGLPTVSVSNTIPTVTNNVANTSSTTTTTTSANNFTYVVAPSNTFVPPIVLNDPQKNLAYVIIPHNNTNVVNSMTQSTSTASVMTSKLQSPVASTSLPVINLTTTQAIASATATTNTTSAGQASSLPAISNYFTIAGIPKTTTSEASISGIVSSNAKGPELPKQLEESIVIDSDSSDDDVPEKPPIIKGSTENESESDELIIDESSPSTESSAKKEDDDAGAKDEDEKTKKKKYKFPMKCSGCSVIFQRLRSMRHHLERRHGCQLCDFKCCKVSDLKQHYILEHRKFFCSRCSILADSKRGFTEHNRRNHICQSCNGFYFNLSHHTCAKITEKDSNGEKSDDKI